MLNFEQYQVLTFDCYGTLIDWESGMLAALKPILLSHNVHLEDEQILERFAEFEAEQERDYKSYRSVLQNVVQQFGEQFGFTPSESEKDSLPDSIRNWLPFPDTVAALKALKQTYKLVIISNVDDDLFALTAPHLQVEFDDVITAQQVKSYKPSTQNFSTAFERINLPISAILHVAASVYHDIVPARSLGLSTVWVDRRAGAGAGAALPAEGQPDVTVPTLQALVDLQQ